MTARCSRSSRATTAPDGCPTVHRPARPRLSASQALSAEVSRLTRARASGSTGPDPDRRSRRPAMVIVQRVSISSSTSRIGAPSSACGDLLGELRRDGEAVPESGDPERAVAGSRCRGRARGRARADRGSDLPDPSDAGAQVAHQTGRVVMEGTASTAAGRRCQSQSVRTSTIRFAIARVRARIHAPTLLIDCEQVPQRDRPAQVRHAREGPAFLQPLPGFGEAARAGPPDSESNAHAVQSLRPLLARIDRDPDPIQQAGDGLPGGVSSPWSAGRAGASEPSPGAGVPRATWCEGRGDPGTGYQGSVQSERPQGAPSRRRAGPGPRNIIRHCCGSPVLRLS